jgi:predicted Zn-dependent protease with MMP-like domain
LFDQLLESHLERLPARFAGALEEVALIVEDEPGPELLKELGMLPGEDLYGMHWGMPLTERSVEAPPEVPDQLMLFRGPIMRLAKFRGQGPGSPEYAALDEQVRVTLLHELGHHFGLDEDDLAEEGYG